MGQFHWDPATYCELIRAEVPEYDQFQDAVVASTSGIDVRWALDLGTGTGETARRILVMHDKARLVGIDESEGMLAGAQHMLPSARVDLRVGRLEDPVPDGPFDLVVSALAVHHLDLRLKGDLFDRIFVILRPGGRFVLGDVVTPDDPADVVTPIDPEYDRPDSIADQLEALRAAGFVAHAAWQRRDLAVLVGDRIQAP
jgi:tRNA (cmo5U34)-methyltransferase